MLTIDPIKALHDDRRRARDCDDPWANLCVLGSVEADGTPNARTLVLRDVDNRLALFINTTSPKHEQISADAQRDVAIVCYFASISIQYRLRCGTEPVPAKTIRESWLLRPPVPKRLDWIYTHDQPQSSAIASRKALVDKIGNAPSAESLTAPDTAVGLFLVPKVIDRLDLGQDNGIHDRRRFDQAPDGWHETLLVP